MKQLLQISTGIVLFWLLTTASCKKDKGVAANLNRYPIAKAGADIRISLASCYDNNGIVTLDGSGSSDPDNNISSQTWAKISGPEGIVIRQRRAVTTQVENISVGTYVFQLIVEDALGLISTDTVIVSASSPRLEYDLDLTINSNYHFIDNYYDNYDYYNSYYDVTTIDGQGIFLPIGEFHLYISEYADTATLSDIHNTYIHFTAIPGQVESVGGTSTINLKKLAREGGGTFSGTFTAQTGSAALCGDVYPDLLPLAVTGTLDTLTKKTTVTIKGRIFF